MTMTKTRNRFITQIGEQASGLDLEIRTVPGTIVTLSALTLYGRQSREACPS